MVRCIGRIQIPFGSAIYTWEKPPISGVMVCPVALDEGGFTFTHDPADLQSDFGYHVCGHVHPGIRLRGAGRQTMRLRCFHFGAAQAVMPAYGAFTGMHVVTPAATDRVFATTGEAVIEV